MASGKKRFHTNPSNPLRLPHTDPGDIPPTTLKNKAAPTFEIDRRTPAATVFQVDEPELRSSLPRTSHWSIAWSDLMMTMFVLFLSMFVYQKANEEFLAERTPEIIGGDTTEALQILDTDDATFPIVPPIRPGLPLITSGTVKKVEPVSAEQLKAEKTVEPSRQNMELPQEQDSGQVAITEETPVPAETIAILIEEPQEIPVVVPVPEQPEPPPATTIEPRPLVIEEKRSFAAIKENNDEFQDIYTKSKGTVAQNNLTSFAAIDLVPDKTMRIILSGDLLFALGQSYLTESAKNSLKKIGTAIKETPYMINVVGHTDNIPMNSDKYKSNWELSVARATTVATFLINEMEMSPNQFVVSGYSSYRPVAANNTAANRARNRRVEIIISKRLPKPVSATRDNLR